MKTFFSSVIALAVFGFSSTLAAPLEIKVNLMAGLDSLSLGKMYKTPSGAQYQVDLLKFYISNITLLKSDGSSLNVPGLSLATFTQEKPDEGSRTMDNGQMYQSASTQGVTVMKLDVPTGDYKGIRFEIGVPSTLNHLDASLQILPLGLDAGMFWAWNPGYIFYRFEGKTMLNNKLEPFLLHLGTDAFRQSVNLFDLQTNKVKISVPEAGGTVNVNLDIAKTFAAGVAGSSYDLAKPEYRAVHGGPVAAQAYVNLLGAWSLKQ
jgi:hypothetical protein